LIEETHSELTNRGPRRISPFFVPASIINRISGHVSMRHGFKGPNLAIVTACTTGLHSIGEAARKIEYGDADIIVAGGSESTVSPLGIGGFAAMRALSTRNDGIRTVTVSSSVKVRVSWCWSPTSTPRRAARKFTVSLQATA
jgi:3-oxoacyl-[acyl-carrier-protein] synthase II